MTGWSLSTSAVPYSSVEANRPISPIRTQSAYRPTPQRRPPPKPMAANIYKVSHSPQCLCHCSCQIAQQMCHNVQHMLMCSLFAHSCHRPFDMLSFIMALHNNPSITCLILELSCLQACQKDVTADQVIHSASLHLEEEAILIVFLLLSVGRENVIQDSGCWHI